MKRAAMVACAAALLAAGSFTATAQEPFYKGKRLTMVINFAAGGPTDIEGRLFARHIVKHIPGNPTIIIQNFDGAGGVVGAQYLGEVAPRDGTAGRHRGPAVRTPHRAVHRRQIRTALTVSPAMRAFIADYMKKTNK